AGEGCVDRMRPVIRAPHRQAEATATDARHLLGGELLIGREDEAEARTDDVEGTVGERERLGVACSSSLGAMSSPVTSAPAPARAARKATSPVPVATSSQRSPACGASAS